MYPSEQYSGKLNFLQGGGEMGSLMRDKDWNHSALGNPENWSIQLKQITATILNSPSPMLICWSKKYIQLYNDAFRPILNGSKRQDILGISAKESYIDIWETLQPLLNNIMQGEPSVFKDYKLLINRNGNEEEVFYDFSCSPIYDENNIIQGIWIICTETTEKVKSLKSIIDSEKRFRTMAESTHILIAVGDENDKPTYFNHAWTELTGKTSEELINTDLMTLIHPDDREKQMNIYLNASIDKMPFAGEVRMLNKQNEYRTLLAQNTARFNDDGSFAGYIGTCIDITEQKIREQQLEDVLETERISKEAADLGTFNHDLIKKTMFWDERCRSLFGITHKEAVGYQKDLVGNLHPDDRDRVVNNINAALNKSGGDGSYEVEYRTIGAEDGKIRWLRAKGKAFFDEQQKPIRFAGSIREITDHVNAKERIEKSESRFRSLIEEAPVATCFFSGRDLKIDIANERMLRFWGKTNDVIGKPLAEAVPELVGQPFLQILDNIYTTGIPYSDNAAACELLVDGVLSTFYFNFTYKPLLNAEGAVYGIMNMAIDVTDQISVQQQIEETQRELLSSFEESPVAIATISKENLTYKIVNTFYAELVGRKPSDLIDKPLLEALPELEGQGFDNLLHEVIATGKPYISKEVFVELIRGGKLDQVYVDLIYQPRRQGSAITGVLVVATDVTEQVITRRKIEESETKLRGIISSAPAGIGLFVGRDLIIENPNQTFIDIVGKGPDIVGKPLVEVMPELLTEGQPFLKILDDAFTTGIEFKSPGSLVKIVQNGVLTHNYYNITYTPVFNAQGEVYAILDIAVDVTAQIKAQQELEDTEAELRNAIEMANLATWTLDIRSGIYHYSPRFMEWLGFSESTKNLDEAYNPLPPSHRASVVAAVAAAIAVGSDGFYDNEHPIVNRLTGQTRIIHAQAQVFYNEAGEPISLTGTAQDITLEKQLQLTLEAEVKLRTEELGMAIDALQATNDELENSNTLLIRSNEELAQFAYIASHDLQEPLRKIGTFSQMLEKNLGENISESAEGYLTKIKSSSARMSNLIKDVLMYSQLVKENQGFEKVNLNDIIQNVIADYDLLIEQKAAIVMHDELPVIDAYALQMTQLFTNLLGNSLKFARNDVSPQISITCTRITKDAIHHHALSAKHDYVHIIFKDNGIGFEAEYVEKIFQIFQRLHNKSTYEGTGIGLAMCKKIALNHNGDIYAEGDLNSGAIFNIILPVTQNH